MHYSSSSGSRYLYDVVGRALAGAHQFLGQLLLPPCLLALELLLVLPNYPPAMGATQSHIDIYVSHIQSKEVVVLVAVIVVVVVIALGIEIVR